jgi:hypothetical protein
LNQRIMPVCIVIMALAAACDPIPLDPISAVDMNGSAAEGSGGSGGGASGAGEGGGAPGACEPWVDVDSCEPNVPFTVVDKATAQRALVEWWSTDGQQSVPVNLWRKCNTAHPSLFDVGVTFHKDGRLTLWRREPDPHGYDLLVCGQAPADTGSWSLRDKTDMGLPDEYYLEILWDDGGSSKADVAFGTGLVSVRFMNEAGEAEELMVF